MELPQYRKLTQCEKFIEGLRQLKSECGVQTTWYNGFGPTKIEFSDGSSGSSPVIFGQAGYLDLDQYLQRYSDRY